MADENIVTNIVANADFSGLIADVNKVTASLSKLQAQIIASDAKLANQVSVMNRSFGENLRRTGQFATHFVTLTSDVEKFGKNLDSGQLKLKNYFQTFQQHTKTQGGLIRELAKQQVALQNAIVQPLGKNAQGLMQYSVHIPQGLNAVKNKTALARQELQIMNKVIQDGGVQLINWGKNTQWAGRQLTVGLTVPLAAFGMAAAKSFREADAELTRLTKVYGGVAASSSADLTKIRNEVSATAKELAKAYGTSFKETIQLAADVAATGKTGADLLGSVKETTRLAVLGEVDRQDAMKATLAIQTAFKQNTEQLTETINFLNSVENQTSTSLADLIEAIPKAGPVVQGLGGSVKDLALYLTAMKEGGINASEGANALKSALASLINPTKVAQESFGAMGISLKNIVNDNAGNLTAMILELQSALDSLNPLQKQQAIEQLFGKFQFARMNALFENLGKQGSQTLQVMDLMKTSSQDLANVASRELSLVTESASGKYKRAVESLKADLAGIGEEFLKVQTFFVNVVDSIIKFVSKLPAPVKTILTLVTGLTAIIGPVIMLTGVLANFFGYIIKGASHFRSLFKGGEGWKMLTPEILAASKAGSLAEATFYNDAKAATVLKTAIQGLIAEFTILEQKAKSGQISVSPAFTTMGGTIVAVGGRQVNPNHPLLSPQDTRSMSHMNPVAGMTTDQRSAQTIFGVVPGAPKVNQKIGNNPQIYAEGDLPKIPGFTSIGGASTGVVAQEAAKWHAMTGALAMQSDAEIKLLKQEVSRTGLITNELSASYQALLPSMTSLIKNAATESSAIVAQLQAGKITVDQARVKIIALNAQVEKMIAGAAVDIAGQQGRSINLTSVPLLNQPVVNNAGKSNMKELSRPGRTRNLLNQIAKGLGVKTFGAPYSTETTIPKRFADGGAVYRSQGSGGPEFRPMGTDTVPAMLTPGEFVVKAGAVNKDTLPFLQSLNEGSSSRPFLSATMIHQGNEANQALAGNRPNVNLTGNYLANDMSSLHSRGLHPMAMFYDQALRLGYGDTPAKKLKLQQALKNAYAELQGSFSRKGDSPINNAYYEKVATSVAMKHLKTVSRFSPTIGRNVRLAEELVMMGHQRNSANKGIQAGSLRTSGFDGVTLPRHLVGTGSGFSGAANQSHFNLAQELYDTPPTNMHTGALGRGNTISQVFGSQRGHIGVKFAPNKLNLMMQMIKNKIGRAPIAQSAESIALTNKWRRRYSDGGSVYMSDGGIVPGYMSGGKVKGYRMGGMVAQTGLGMLGSMAGQSLGQSVGGDMGGSLGGMAGFMLPGMLMGGRGGSELDISSKLEKSIFSNNKWGQSLAKNVAEGGKLTSTLSRVALGLTKFNLVTGVAVGAAVALYTAYKKHQEQLKLNAIGFGLTADAAAKAGLKYTDYNQKIKDSIQKSKDLMEANKLAYQSMTSAGIPIKMTITEYQKLKEEVKGAYSEQIKLINSTKNSKLGDVATQLKEQLIAAGMSAEEATKKIYAMFALSQKSGMAASSTVGNKDFSSIQDAQGAAVGSLKGYNAAARLGEAKAQAAALNTSLTAIDAGISEIISKSEEAARKDKTGKTEKISQYNAELKMMELLKKSQYGQTTITKQTINEMAKANPTVRELASTSDTVVSIWQKLRLQAAGLAGDLSKLTSDQTAALYNLSNAINKSVIDNNKGTKDKPGLLADEYSKLNTLQKQRDAAAKSAAGQSVKAQIDSKQRLKDLQAQIDATNKLANSRIKALDAAKAEADLNREMQSAKLELQFAESTGNTQQAAQARLRYQSALESIQNEGQRKSIQSAADKANAGPLAEIEKINNANDKLANAASLAGDNIAALDKKILALTQTIDGLNNTQTAYNLNLVKWLDEHPGGTKAEFDQTNTGKYLSSGLVEPTKAAGGIVKGSGTLIPFKDGLREAKSAGQAASDLSVKGITTGGGNITANDIVIGGKSLKDGIGGNKDLNIKIKTTNNTAGILGNFVAGVGNPGAQPYSNKSYTVSAADLVNQGFSRENIFKGQSVRIGGKDYIIDGGIDKNGNVPIKIKKAGYGMKNIDPKIPTVVGDRGPELIFGNMVIPNLADVPYASPSYNVPSAAKQLSSVGTNSGSSNVIVNQSFYQAPGENTDAFMRKVTQATVAAIGKDAKINRSQIGESRSI